MTEVYYKFISGHLAKVYSKFISGGQMQAEAGGLAEVYYKFISDGKMQLRLEICERFITSLSVGIWQRPSLLVGD